MAKRYEQIVADYWEVSKFLRDPDAPGNISNSEAFELLRSSDRLRPTEWRLMELMHVITYDIIEGNTNWRPESKIASGGSRGRILLLNVGNGKDT